MKKLKRTAQLLRIWISCCPLLNMTDPDQLPGPPKRLAEASKEVLLREWSDARWLFLQSRDDSQYWRANYYLAAEELGLLHKDLEGHIRGTLGSVSWLILKGGRIVSKNGWYEAILDGKVVASSANFHRIPIQLAKLENKGDSYVPFQFDCQAKEPRR